GRRFGARSRPSPLTRETPRATLAAMGHDLLVRGGAVVDGSGLPRFDADVAIEAGRVVEAGRLPGRSAPRGVDAADRVVPPRFVAPHTHYDPQLHWDGLATPSLFHGVTTVVTGNCGVTLAPAAPRTAVRSRASSTSSRRSRSPPLSAASSGAGRASASV